MLGLVVPLGTHHISALQAFLKAAHSTDTAIQLKAAHELCRLVEKNVFPAVSFSPLVHALSKLIQSKDRAVSCHAARAVKTLLLDDALRPQAVSVGLPTVLVEAMQNDHILQRDFLGAIQTLFWDHECVACTVEAGAAPLVMEFLGSRDQDVSMLAVSTFANMLAVSDSFLLTDEVLIRSSAECMGVLLERAQGSDNTTRCYAVAALANASAHPSLAAEIIRLGGLERLHKIESSHKANLSLGGTRVAECAETAVLRLSSGGTIIKDPAIALRKYTFKWGTEPVMELLLDPQVHLSRLQVCVVIWVLCVVLLFYPLVFSHRTSAIR
jgi:hypothetical protein